MWIENEIAGGALAGAWLGLQIILVAVFGATLDDAAPLLVVSAALLWRLRR